MTKVADLLSTLSPPAQALIEVDEHRIDHLISIIRESKINERDTSAKIFKTLRTTMVAYRQRHKDVEVPDITFDGLEGENGDVNFHIGRAIFTLTRDDIWLICRANISD